MSNSIPKTIKELLIFYVKTNYENYLKENQIKYIENDKIKQVVESIYYKRKDHSKQFVLDSLKKMLKNEYPGDNQILLLLRDIYDEDLIMITKMTNYIKEHQKND